MKYWLPEDHPRIRGEHSRSHFRVGSEQGSSPHTRGAPLALALLVIVAGIIPAYAGSTRARWRTTGWHWDHPRIRGEHNVPNILNAALQGSSPHTRGAPSVSGETVPVTGIIPAYAGSTAYGRGLYVKLEDHPRIRGEHRKILPLSLMAKGSSPHTRGAL